MEKSSPKSNASDKQKSKFLMKESIFGMISIEVQQDGGVWRGWLHLISLSPSFCLSNCTVLTRSISN